jgi:acyl-[acyl-carrier-protein]-phospholipid O-acyltransferase/long-chain-fatty-acid--[acyl-carrier-protein] ligase
MTDESPVSEPTRRQWTGYWSMIVQQTQNAFNDKMAQFILIPLAGAVAFRMPLPGGAELGVESAAGLLITLPFVLFAPIAGWLSDRYSKRDVMFASAVLQLLVLLGICGAVWIKNLPLALLAFFMLATQAAFFSPAKFGINKELVGSRHLGFASSIQQMTAMLAILVGQIIAGWLFDRRYQALGGEPVHAWQAALEPMMVLTLLAAPALLMAWIIPRVPAQGGARFTPKVAVGHFTHVAELWRDAPLRRGAMGVAFFWGFAGFINLWSVKLAKEISGGGEGFGTLSSLFMAAASLGMAAGFGCSSYLLRRRIELGWVPLAGLAMAAASVALANCPTGSAAGYLLLLETDPLSFVVKSPGEALFLTVLGMLAFFSAIFLAPLNAWLQDHYPPDKRGELQAAVNLQDCLAGILAVALIVVFEVSCKSLGIAPLEGFRMQMIFISITCLFASLYIIRMLPADFIRVIGVAFIRAFYRIRTTHPDRLPAKGGVLLLPNHVTYADAFFISAASPRPVRFVMDEVFTASTAVRVFTGIFDTVNIRRDQSLEAIRIVIRALKDGDVVCLFPEGQLTRTGTLSTLQRGFELIARKAGHPLIPMWCDGSWGSIYSFERNRFFRKIPHHIKYGITVAFGQAIDPETADIESVRNGMLAASSDAVARRFAGRVWSRRMPQGENPAINAFRGSDSHTRRRLWVNAHQIGMVNALPRRQVIHILAADPVLTDLTSLTAAFPALFGGSIRLHENFDGDHNGVWAGGDHLRHEIHYSQITAGQIQFYDFGMDALKPVERAGLCHCPCLEVDGLVVAMSMPHPPPVPADMDPQHGHKPRSWGKLLPGWHIGTDPASGLSVVKGPAAPHHGLALPAGCKLDAEGFLVC